MGAIVQEVKVEQPLKVTPVEGGQKIEIFGGRPPLTPLFFGAVGGLLFILIGSSDGGLRVAAYMGWFLVGLCVWHWMRHTKSQFVSIVNNKLVVNDKAYDISNISRIEFGNAITKTTSASFTPTTTTYVAVTPNMGAAVGAGMANAATGIANAGAASNAKKAFYVAIFFGNKKIKVAKNMREPTGLAFYDELGRLLGMN